MIAADLIQIKHERLNVCRYRRRSR